jgi:hypothetical protein
VPVVELVGIKRLSIMGSHRRITGAPPASALMLTLLCASWVLAAAQNYSAIFNFGDSITDTGNLCTNGRPSQITFTQPPYGETFFGTPTCRCSDGRVVVDFLSTLLDLSGLSGSLSSRPRMLNRFKFNASSTVLCLITLSRPVRTGVPPTVQVEQRGLQAGREHGDHGRDGHGRALLPVAGALRQDLEQRAHQLSAPVVPADRHFRLRAK